MKIFQTKKAPRSSLKAFRCVEVDNTGLRSNFTKDLQAIESAEHFINLALERMEIKSLDELDRPVKEKYVAGKSKSRRRLPKT